MASNNARERRVVFVDELSDDEREEYLKNQEAVIEEKRKARENRLLVPTVASPTDSDVTDTDSENDDDVVESRRSMTEEQRLALEIGGKESSNLSPAPLFKDEESSAAPEIHRKVHSDEDPSEYVHVEQSFPWDCGLACVEMLLRQNGLGAAVNGRHWGVKDLHRISTTKSESVWTIDLAYLLLKFRFPVQFYTKVFGVNKQHSQNKFYQQDFDEDELRVNTLFENASKYGVRISPSTPPLDDLKTYVGSEAGVLIVLVNKALLTCRNPHHKQGWRRKLKGIFSRRSYIGHFILVHHYHWKEDMFTYEDPAIPDGPCVISAQELEMARRSEGTDDDILFVPKFSRPTPSPGRNRARAPTKSELARQSMGL